ncbi:MAG: NRDE family protein [Altibacter sp.]|uniref:NRDE family protein n=1 Tax=Altibacter sp. TaxID=2024823 RepID=UPI001DB1CEF2|nr:NRDE family protein [Altibacter sp.]MBZ0328074.1 NRDE family protein [Altibacter sp.]
MCTVTFIPKGIEGFVLTSNRDEAPGRNTLAPQIYSINDVELLFPKDEVAGGTWIGASSKNRLICLMNGGFTTHNRKDTYRMSRGVIVTDLLTSEDVIADIELYDFTDIEPFTIIMVEWQKDLRLYELVWDGTTSHFSEKPLAPQIWSSSLLYSEAIKRKRESWFSDFLFEHLNPTEAELLYFHKTAGEGNIETNVIMDRGFVKTKSITQVVKKSKLSMRYEDLQTQEVYLNTIN